MKKTVYITEKQFNKMGLPKKVRQNLIRYGDGEEKNCNYELSSASGDLGYSHVVNGDAGTICEGKIIKESLDPNFDLTPYINSYNDFLVREGLPVKPFPELILSNDDQDGVMIKTGYYLPDEKSITLFVKDRHPKDILRSYAHEMVHHMQNLEDPKRDWGTGGDLKEDETLSGLESDAYERGNMLFRKWTEELRKQPDNRLNETTQRKNDQGEIVPETCNCGGKICTQIHGEPVFICDKCGKYYGTLPFKKPLNEELLTRGHFAKYKISDEELEEHYKRTRDWGEKLVALRKRYDPDGIDKRFDIDEATANDVDLTSFQVRDALNPKIWKGDKLDPKVRVKLMDIADDFYDTLGVSWVKPEDVIIVGSIANYNWSRFSDIDLHLVIDYDKVDKRKKFVETFFKSKKKEWNSEHDIKICGFPVEVFVQDAGDDVSSSGVYSIEKNDWIKKPVRGTFTKKDIDSFIIKSKAADIMTKIEDIEDDYGKEGNEKDVYNKADKLISKITTGRKDTLQTSKDEMNDDNIVFKVLRRNGYLDKLFKLRDKSYDKSKSMN